MSVKLRRYMSVWMLLVAYCFSVGAAAYAVLSCHCMGQEKARCIYAAGLRHPYRMRFAFGRF